VFTGDSREQWDPPSMVSGLRFRNRLLAGFAGARNYVVLRCCSQKGGKEFEVGG